MYCYECAKGGKIHYVPAGLGKCVFGHNIYVGLKKELEISEMINEIREQKEHDLYNYVREFIKNERK
jgi:hypothetical protein